jgi:hypothetical protein
VEEGEKTGERTTGMHSNLFVTLPTLHIIDELRDVNLHGWTPVRDRGMGWR